MQAHLSHRNAAFRRTDALPVDSIGTLVVTMVITGLGKVEPLSDILNGLPGIRIHIDAVYGGFFKIISSYYLTQQHIGTNG